MRGPITQLTYARGKMPGGFADIAGRTHHALRDCRVRFSLLSDNHFRNSCICIFVSAVVVCSESKRSRSRYAEWNTCQITLGIQFQLTEMTGTSLFITCYMNQFTSKWSYARKLSCQTQRNKVILANISVNPGLRVGVD